MGESNHLIGPRLILNPEAFSSHLPDGPALALKQGTHR